MKARYANSNDLEAAADTLAAAFEHYVWTRYVLPEHDYYNRLRALQRLYLDYAHQHGLVAVTGPSDGVIALLPPTAPEPSAARVEQIVALHGDRLERLAHAPAPAQALSAAWRLETLGVLPAKQGQGRAAALLKFALAEVAAQGGRNIKLVTSDARNVRLYERHGFSVMAQVAGGDGPPVWELAADIPDSGFGDKAR